MGGGVYNLFSYLVILVAAFSSPLAGVGATHILLLAAPGNNGENSEYFEDEESGARLRRR